MTYYRRLFCGSAPAHTGSVECEERERLIEIHRDAVAKYDEAQKGVPEPKGEGWREAWYKPRGKPA